MTTTDAPTGSGVGGDGGPTPSDVMTQMVGGFQVSQALCVIAELDVATLLGARLSRRHAESMRDLTRFWMQTHYASFADLLHTAHR